ncbi:uncharacterized protein LOC111875784 [Cryptotermes secundus]|uniref:uncharacterized protein LOC111875784 n=1 Tax=Cryptotermes secundus TaxID=105785 RepID=UPI000CD7D901|nr:uncharacterized protein LOC111875784 [Cryptotermes secundus]
MHAGPRFAPTWQARGTQLDQMSSGNTHVNAYQRNADLFAPDQSAFPETPGQFWEMYGAHYLQIAREIESLEASSIPAELPVAEERPPGVLTEAGIERLPSYKQVIITSCVYIQLM